MLIISTWKIYKLGGIPQFMPYGKHIIYNILPPSKPRKYILELLFVFLPVCLKHDIN